MITGKILIKNYGMMKMKKIFAVLLLMLVAFSANMTTAQQMPPIPVDPEVRVGKLDNGLTYYIRHNDYPEQRANFYIAQRVGSMQEEENQRGLAHFLEHMAFNGSEHFKGNGIIDYTRSLGVAFGADLNAATGFNSTIYHVNNVPSTRQSALDSCLLILKDWSHGLLLEDEEIDKERGVIHQEWRTRHYYKRMLEHMLPAMYPDSKHGQRMVIGLMDVVDNFPYQDLRDYYHKWYRPDNQALVIVGDVDVDYTEAKIREMFKDIPVDPNSPKVEPFPVPDNEQGIYFVNPDKELTQNYITTYFKHDATPKELKSSVNYLIVGYMNEMLSSMLNVRLAEKAQEPDCPFTVASCKDGDYLVANTKDAFTVDCYPKEGMTEAALQAVLVEVLRAKRHGFTATEYVRAQQEFMSQLEQRYNNRGQIDNNTFAMAYCSNFLDGEPIMSVEDEYQLMNQIVPNVPFDYMNQGLQQLMNEYVGDTDRNLVVVSNEAERGGSTLSTSEGLKAAYQSACNANIEPYQDNVKQEPLMSSLPKKGKITKESVNSELGYKELTLSNGARVLLKKTDFKQDEIIMLAMRRGGKSLYGEKDMANLAMMDQINAVRKLGDFTNNDLSKTMAGKQAGASYVIDYYTDGVSASSTVKDMETMFQLTYLTFTDMRKDQQAFTKVMTQQASQLANRASNLDDIYNDSVSYTYNNHSWHVKSLKPADLQQVNLDRMMQIAHESLANAADYTFIIVGSFDEQAVRANVEQYIASLPGKKGKKSNWENIASHPKGHVVNNFTVQMETPKTQASVIWYNENMPVSFESMIKIQILRSVMEKVLMQKIREDAGATYTLYVMGNSSWKGDKSLTELQVICPLKPEFTQTAMTMINEEMLNACNAIDPGTVNDIKENLVKNFATASKMNFYWSNILLIKCLYDVDIYNGWEETIKSQTPESVSAFARQLLSSGNRIEVVMSPEQ